MENPLIQKERYLILYKLTPIMMLANIIASSILVALMWDVVPHNTLITWLAVVFIVCSITFAIYLYLKPFYKKLETIPEYPIYYFLPLTFGMIWGAAGYLFFTPDSMTHTAYLIIFLFGMASGAINALSPIWLAHVALSIPALLPFSIRLLSHGYTHSLLLGFTIITFLFILLIISKMSNNSITQTLQIRYENTHLLKSLKAQTEQAEKANKDKSRFLAAASHDLRQPIHSLSLLASAISPEVTTERGKKILSQIENANQAMLNLLHSLLDMSKLEAGIVKPENRPVHLENIIASLYSEFKPIAEEQGLELRSRTCPFLIKTDPTLLTTIIRNLLQNAIRYTKDGEILIACRKRNNHVYLQVWDTGKGIDEEHLELIFAEYQQLHNPERDQNKGLGLGLSICQRLATLLDIKIDLKSKVGKGSVFSLQLPILEETILPSFTENNHPQKVSKDDSNPFENKTLLIIDDNQSVLDAMTSLLENWGCNVLTADSVDTTADIANSTTNQIDAIIADYRLRENTTGVDAINAFCKKVDYKPPSLLITGDTAPEQMHDIESHGLPILHKPIKEPHLKSVISRLLRMSA